MATDEEIHDLYRLYRLEWGYEARRAIKAAAAALGVLEEDVRNAIYFGP